MSRMRPLFEGIYPMTPPTMCLNTTPTSTRWQTRAPPTSLSSLQTARLSLSHRELSVRLPVICSSINIFHPFLLHFWAEQSILTLVRRFSPTLGLSSTMRWTTFPPQTSRTTLAWGLRRLILFIRESVLSLQHAQSSSLRWAWSLTKIT